MAVEFVPMAARPVDTQGAGTPEAMLAVVTPVVALAAASAVEATQVADSPAEAMAAVAVVTGKFKSI
jgi:hypothetical protein